MSNRSYITHLETHVSSAAPEAEPAEPTTDTCEVFSTDERRVARVRANLMSERTVQSLADTFRVLGDPTRVRLLDALAQHELCVCELAAIVGSSESAVSHQLRVLRSQRIVRHRRAGRMIFYALDDYHIKHLFAQALRHVEEPAGSSMPASDGA
ncbi:MAG: ArsR/SmtB family transcription factor [Vicinamibacterales bacterium]